MAQWRQLVFFLPAERDEETPDWTEIVTTKLQSALSCKMKRQTDCLTERKFSLFLQQTQQTLVFCFVLAASSRQEGRASLITNSDSHSLW